LLLSDADRNTLSLDQKALLLAGQKLLAHDRVRAIRQFPELVHLQG